MRRWLGGLVALSALSALLAGCGMPAGVDGDLVDDWSPAGEPRALVPAADTCRTAFNAGASLGNRVSVRGHVVDGSVATPEPSACSASHEVETVHVGTFEGAGEAPPAAGSNAVRTAFADCDAKAKQFVGGDWRGARLQLWVALPPASTWAGGGRWYRCDVGELATIDHDVPTARTASLKGAAGGPSPLRLGCFRPAIVDDLLNTMEAVPCTQPHRAEFVGVWTAPDTRYTDFVDTDTRAHGACRDLVAAYAKLPKDGDLESRVGTIYYSPSEEQWADGNRGVQCFLWNDRDLRRSVKGAGPSALPAR
ncbi:septum formation family protein [Phytohabitans suffuscus]|uniref:Septum formation-related domain-containing protein n=1 Tax=Phytohabitans suffuscus TaxID=624315 RepID=A0A6F8YVG9_9ACTN|nr:septum formation family protein [Phytohabitans suffuscus]BCB90137.1 hypothetical protein Psuf_074500 [Phytohabitans suffuscus]